jgi:hypothetical protein
VVLGHGSYFVLVLPSAACFVMLHLFIFPAASVLFFCYYLGFTVLLSRELLFWGRVGLVSFLVICGLHVIVFLSLPVL